LAGSFLTTASFLKLGHAAYFGQRRSEHENVQEAPASMLLPMLVLAAACIFFGVGNSFPLERLIQPSVGLQHEHFSGWPHSARLVWLTVAVLVAAVMNHIAGARIYGTGIKAVDHIHYAPLLKPIYERAEARMFDPYEIGLDLAFFVARAAWAVDQAIDWVYNRLAVSAAFVCAGFLKTMHTGDYALYVAWALGGAAIVIWYVVS
jgi:NADH-quinone oxidoreductase subunit L